MYWPVGTPRIYATSSTNAQYSGSGGDGGSILGGAAAGPTAFNLVVSHDGIESSAAESSGGLDVPAGASTADPPLTPLTPAVKSVEHEYNDGESTASSLGTDDDGARGKHGRQRRPSVALPEGIPLEEPVLAIKVSRPGHLFVTITATSMTVWQTKVRRSHPSMRRNEPCS